MEFLYIKVWLRLHGIKMYLKGRNLGKFSSKAGLNLLKIVFQQNKILCFMNMRFDSAMYPWYRKFSLAVAVPKVTQ